MKGPPRSGRGGARAVPAEAAGNLAGSDGGDDVAGSLRVLLHRVAGHEVDGVRLEEAARQRLELRELVEVQQRPRRVGLERRLGRGEVHHRAVRPPVRHRVAPVNLGGRVDLVERRAEAARERGGDGVRDPGDSDGPELLHLLRADLHRVEGDRGGHGGGRAGGGGSGVS